MILFRFSLSLFWEASPPGIATLLELKGLGALMTLWAVLSGVVVPGRISSGKLVPGELPDEDA